MTGKKRINVFTWKIKWIVVYFLVIFFARRLLFPSQCASFLLASSRRWKIQFGCSERNFLISFVVFLIESPLDVALICRFCRLGPSQHPESFPRCCARKYLLSSALSIKRGRRREERRTNCGKFGICFIVRLAGAEKSAPPPRINCLNDFQLFNSNFFWVITRFGCFCRLSAFRLPAFAKLCPAGDGSSSSATNDLPATSSLPSLLSLTGGLRGRVGRGLSVWYKLARVIQPRLVLEGFRPPNRARLQRFCFCVLLLRAALEVFNDF